MLIVTQDKKAIHNLDNILSIQVEGKRIVVYDMINDYSALGEYATEERANEVFKLFLDFYSREDYAKRQLNFQAAILAIKARKNSYFEMPEE